MLENLGFSIIFMEDISLQKQWLTAYHADIIVAPHGAGLTNILFCRPSTILVELLPEDYMANHFYRFSLLGQHNYYPLVGKMIECDELLTENSYLWQIDSNRLRSLVISLLNSD